MLILDNRFSAGSDADIHTKVRTWGYMLTLCARYIGYTDGAALGVCVYLFAAGPSGARRVTAKMGAGVDGVTEADYGDL